MKFPASYSLAILMAAICFLSAAKALAIPSLSVTASIDKKAAKSLTAMIRRDQIMQAFILLNFGGQPFKKLNTGKSGKYRISVKSLLYKLVNKQNPDRTFIMGGGTACPM